MDEKIATGKKNAGVRRICHGVRNAFLKRPYYRKFFRVDRMVSCSVLKKLKLTSENTLGREAIQNKVTRLDAEQHASVACLQSKMEYYEGQPVPLELLQFSLGETEVIKEGYLAAVAVVEDGAGLKSRKRSVTGKSKKCECFVAQYVKKEFGL